MANIIQIKRGTGSSEPSNGSLAEGELAINLDSGKLFYGSGSSVLSDFKFDKLTTETHVISSSVTYMTTSFSSGSTAFGDTADDTHTFTGNITASGKISSSNIIYGSAFYALGNVVGLYHPASSTVRLAQAGKATSIYGSDITLGAPVTSSYHISSSGWVFASELVVDNANIDTIYSPIAGGSGIVTVGTIGTGTWNGDVIAEAKLQNQSGTNTGDEDQASINALDITEVGALADGTIASGFGNIDNGSSTLDTGALTATTITVPTRVYADPGTNAGDHTGGDVWYFGTGATLAGGIYYLNSTGTWSKANATAATGSTGMLAVALGDDPDVDGMLLRGFVTLLEIDGIEDHGKILYVKASDGEATVTAPSTSGNIVRIIGYAIHNTDDAIYFNPDNTWVEIA